MQESGRTISAAALAAELGIQVGECLDFIFNWINQAVRILGGMRCVCDTVRVALCCGDGCAGMLPAAHEVCGLLGSALGVFQASGP